MPMNKPVVGPKTWICTRFCCYHLEKRYNGSGKHSKNSYKGDQKHEVTSEGTFPPEKEKRVLQKPELKWWWCITAECLFQLWDSGQKKKNKAIRNQVKKQQIKIRFHTSNKTVGYLLKLVMDMKIIHGFKEKLDKCLEAHYIKVY